MDDAARTTPVPAGPDLTGRTLGDFRVLRRLGQGGMGQVYLAEQVSLKRKVALKILRPDLAADPTSLQRFKLEAESVARATHANIVQVYAIGAVEGLPYMALEYVAGKNLREYLARKGPPDLPLAVSIMRQVAAALARAAELGIIHRDIKPENILLTRKGEAKVADFGLSRCRDGDRPPLNLTQSGTTMGTPLYMSPEQVEGRPLDPRTDIYSFGVTCYHLLAGQPPFRGASAFDVALQHVRTDPAPLSAVRPDLPAALCAIVHKMLAKDPARRYQTARELLKDLARLRESLSGTAAVVAGAPPPAGAVTLPAGPDEEMPARATELTATARRSRLPLLAGLSLLLVLAAGAAFGWVRRPHAPPLTAVTPPPTPCEAERVSPHERERALRTLVERALSAPPGSPTETLDSFRLCLQLGLLYLDTDRLDEAGQLFTRLSGMARPYRVLGQLGRGIVLALRSQPQESNRMFREVFFNRPNPQPPPARRFELWQNPEWRYWMIRALHYNAANGLPDAEVPRALRGLLHPHP